jgi:hypothetical protein
VKKSRKITVLAVAGAISLFASAQDKPKTDKEGRSSTPRAERLEQQNTQPANVNPQNTQPQPQNQVRPPSTRPDVAPNNQYLPSNRRGQNSPMRLHPFGPRAGDWLRQFKDVPPDQQERALTNDPNFQKLPSDRQDKLRRQLHQFNNLPDDKKEQLLDRMEKFETLPPEQRQRLRAIQERMRQLPDDRQQRVRRAFHFVKGMTPEQRQNFFASSRFSGQFNSEEQEILRGLVEIEGTPELAEHPDPRVND